MPVFFIHSTDVGNGAIRIGDPLLSHLSKSLRTKVGDKLIFNDDQGRRYHASITHITKKSLEASIDQIQDHTSSTTRPLILGQALLKGEKMGWVIQKATELGVSAIVPLMTDRVIVKLSEKQREGHQMRWNRIAREAAQQSERWTLPTILPLQTFQKFSQTVKDTQVIFMAEREQSAPLLTIPFDSDESSKNLTLMVGPEGGWSTDEVQTARAKEWAFASFGKEILRAETASLAALAILHARLIV